MAESGRPELRTFQRMRGCETPELGHRQLFLLSDEFISMNYLLVDIRDNNILAFRHFLLEGPEAWEPLKRELQTDDETAAGYVSLLLGAFSVAVRRKFSPSYTVADIVRFVAELRIKAEEDSVTIDPLFIEDVIRRAVDAPPLNDDESPGDLTAVLNAKVFILLHLVAESHFTTTDLDRFIEDVTNYTRDWLAAQRADANSQPPSLTA